LLVRGSLPFEPARYTVRPFESQEHNPKLLARTVAVLQLKVELIVFEMHESIELLELWLEP
jgi:hypothetical protein